MQSVLSEEKREETCTRDALDSEHLSRDFMLALMRTSRAADTIAHDGHWEDALKLLHGAASRLPASGRAALPVPPFDPLKPPEAQYQSARELIANRVRESLGRALEERLWVLHVLGRRVFIGFVLVVAVVLVGPTWRRIRDRDLTLDATWKVSSTADGRPNGTFPALKIRQSLPAYFFHTEQQSAPRLDIDLRSEHAVDRIVVVNRHDCCYERARGLKILLSLDGEHFGVVAERDAVSFFRRWEVTFPPKQARNVRLELPAGTGILHLSDVRVYGR